MDELIISVFCDVDNFYKKFELYIKEHCLSCNEKLSTKMCSHLTEKLQKDLMFIPFFEVNF